ncbi:MAG: hypoxanthine phosphoribosyltransferase, partial [Dietzia sp.]
MSADKYADEIESVLLDEDTIRERIAEIAARVGERYADVEKEVVLVAVLKGAAIFVSDFARALPIP